MLIIFEDNEYCAINKPANVPVDGSHPMTVETLTAPRQLKLVHELDSPTSGVLLLAKTRKSAAAAALQFEERKTRKYYIAVVKGRCFTREIEGPIEDDDSDSRQFKMRIGGAKDAKTHVETLCYNEELNESLVLLMPITGRRHQLRVHLLSVGNPILGDNSYFPEDASTPRLMLHAVFLRNAAVGEDLWAPPEHCFFENFPGTGLQALQLNIESRL